MKKRLKNSGGFTLIEIIAVLVILGILAAVAIPKYLDLQEQAAVKGAQGIVGGAMSSVSLSYATQLLNSGNWTAANLEDACNSTAITGDFNLACSANATTGNVLITVTHGQLPDGSISETWVNPEAQ